MNVATIKVLSSGWATVPVVLSPGAARGQLKIGSLSTQTDLYNVHPDGSTQLAILTAHVPAAGDYSVTEDVGPAPGPAAPAVIPNVAVWATQGGESWGVRLRSFAPLLGSWLSGPLVIERRYTAPFAHESDDSSHPWLHAIFDVRYYRDGAVRVSLTVENCLEGATPQDYTLSVHLDGVDLMEPPLWLEHLPYSRYRLTFPLNGLQEALVLPDWSTAVAAGAVPKYPERPTVGVPQRWTYPPLSTGWLQRHMPETGARSELGPAPAWAAQAIGGGTAALAETLAYGENPSGAWCIHVRQADGSLPTIDQRPQWRLMPYVDPADPHFVPDHEHQPSLAYVPYLATGDRFYAEEMAFWANFSLANTHLSTRSGSAGLMIGEETRGAAWGLLRVLEAAAYLPDDDPLKAHFANKARNNLAWWGNHARTAAGAWGVAWHGTFWEHGRQCVRPWTYDYLAHVLGRAAAMGFGRLADDWLRAWLDFRVGWLADPGYHQWAAAYTLPVDDNNTPGDYSGVWQDPLDWRRAHYWPDVLLSVTVAEERGDPRAAEARRWVVENARPEPSFASRPHFGVLPRPTPVPPPEPEDPLYPVISEALGVEAGLPDLEWDATNQRYKAGIGYRINSLIARGKGIDPSVASVTFGPAGSAAPDGRGWPIRGAAFVPMHAGLHEARFATASGQPLVIPVMVEEADIAVAGPLRTVASSYQHGTTSDDAIGVAPDQYSDKELFFNSVNFAEIWVWRGTPDDMRQEGPWVTRITGYSYPDLGGICNGGDAVMDPETGAVLMLELRQLPGVGAGYGFEELLISVPQENPALRTWRCVGPMSGHPVSYEQYLQDPDSYGGYICGGGSLHLVGNAFGDGKDYLFGYPSQVTGKCTSADLRTGDPAKYLSVTCLRAELRPLMADALAGRDCRHHWQGWNGKTRTWGTWNSERTSVMPFGGYGGAKVFYLRGRWYCLHHGFDATWSGLYLSRSDSRMDGDWTPPKKLWSVSDIPNPWPSSLTGQPMWGAPMVLDVDETSGTFLAGIVPWDGRDTDLGGGTGEVRVVVGRVSVR